MVLQHSLVGKSLHWHVITRILFNAKAGICYAVIPSFISCFTTFSYLDLYFTFKFIIFNILVCLVLQLHIHVTVVLG